MSNPSNTDRLAHNARFQTRLNAGERLAGTFVKTPHPSVIEVLGRTGLDFLVLDGEHAPFDRASIDPCLMAGVGVGCPIVIRVPKAAPDWILPALDGGAAGIMAPHVSSAEDAAEVASLLRYENGTRGFSPSPRAGDFGGRTIAEHLERAPQETVLICQIEDQSGVDAAADIAATDGVDALFIGPVDLAVALGCGAATDERVVDCCRKVIDAARGRAASGLFVAEPATANGWYERGATLFVSGSDQAMLRAGARTVTEKITR